MLKKKWSRKSLLKKHNQQLIAKVIYEGLRIAQPFNVLMKVSYLSGALRLHHTIYILCPS
jgi:hypothetical protein